MDSLDWVNFIDEYHCTDYWYEDYDPNDDPCYGCDCMDNDEDLEEDNDDER